MIFYIYFSNFLNINEYRYNSRWITTNITKYFDKLCILQHNTLLNKITNNLD
jgi:hypothetical protein